MLIRRKKSIFGRLGFSSSGKSPKSPPPGSSRSTPSLVSLPQSQSASSFGSFGSFAAVAEAVPTRPGQPSPRANSNLSKSSSIPVHSLGTGSQEHLEAPGTADSQAEPSLQATTGATGETGRYVKTKVKNKSKREFNHLFLAQELFHQPVSLTGSLPTTAIPPVTAPPPSAKEKALPPSPGAQYATYMHEKPPSRPAVTPRSAASQTSRSKRGGPAASAIWSLKVSPDGNYLASAGQDGVVRVWQVISGGEEREAAIAAATRQRGQSVSLAEAMHDEDEKGKHQKSRRHAKEKKACRFCANHDITCPGVNACKAKDYAEGATPVAAAMPVFAHEPLHEWTGHTGDVLDLSWSKVSLPYDPSRLCACADRKHG